MSYSRDGTLDGLYLQVTPAGVLIDLLSLQAQVCNCVTEKGAVACIA